MNRCYVDEIEVVEFNGWKCDFWMGCFLMVRLWLFRCIFLMDVKLMDDVMWMKCL